MFETNFEVFETSFVSNEIFETKCDVIETKSLSFREPLVSFRFERFRKISFRCGVLAPASKENSQETRIWVDENDNA